MMNKEKIRQMLEDVKTGAVSIDDALDTIKQAPFEDMGFAKVDHHRGVRQGCCEVIFGEGKTPHQIEKIVRAMQSAGNENILITRMSEEAASLLSKDKTFEYHVDARLGIASVKSCENPVGSVVVASGGTSDIPVCEEAVLTAQALGSRVTRLYDVGVSGIHRLLSNLDIINSAKVIIAVAGMEGALASVIGGLADCPVIAVPTSVGYGANFGGVTALLSMLNSCASGVSVVNIDNGFGAGYLAHMINRGK